MALERQSIEKKDFPVGRRGYEPEAVDGHLASVADEVEQLKRASRQRSETLASSASEQVRAIVEAAETSATAIQRDAEQEAREIRTEANSEAERAREQATDQARDYVGRVSEATAAMLERIDAMESELSALVESLKTGSNRLNADLQLLEGNLGALRDSAAPKPRFEPESVRDEAASEEGGVGSAGAAGGIEETASAIEHTASSREEVSSARGARGPEPEARAAAGESDDTEGARLIALNMALNGTPREETDRYLEANFRLENRHSLLDEVYASVEG